MEEVTIHVFMNSEGHFEYNIFNDMSPDDIDDISQADSGGICTTTMKNAVDMAKEVL